VPGAGRSPGTAHVDLAEAELADQARERLAAAEAQVIAARVEVARERTPGERQAHEREPSVRRRAQQQASARAQHAANLRQPRGRVGDVLDHLPRPDHVKARIFELPRPLRGDQAQVELRVARPRTPQRLLGDVDPHHTGAGPSQLRGEAPLAAADVQHARAGAHVIQQEASAQGEVGRFESLRHSLPKGFVVLKRGHPRQEG